MLRAEGADILSQVEAARSIEDLVRLHTLVAGDSLQHRLMRAVGEFGPDSPLIEQEGAWFRGPILIGRGAEVLPGSVIFGPAIIGDGAVVGPNAHLKDGVVLGAGAVAGAGCEIKASILGSGALAWHFGYIGNSVIGRDARVGAGFVSAVRRHDDRSIRIGDSAVEANGKFGVVVGPSSIIGVHVSAMPGTVIEGGSVISPHREIRGRVTQA